MTTLQCPFDSASLDCYPADNAKGAVVVCPGGGYQFLSDREDQPIAQAFNRAGYHAFVLRYSVDPPPLGWRPLRQLGWAVSAIRKGAAGVSNVREVSVCGFSAGGHLAASLGVLWHRADLFAPGTNLTVQKPDALILSYPVITAGAYAHRNCFEQLAGQDTFAWEAFSLEKLVTPKTPPAFLWHTIADESVPVQNSLLFFEELLRCGVTAELHLYPFGVHGLSLATPEVGQPDKNRLPDAHVATWMPLALQWLDQILPGQPDDCQSSAFR